jgi:hypothetical protein
MSVLMEQRFLWPFNVCFGHDNCNWGTQWLSFSRASELAMARHAAQNVVPSNGPPDINIITAFICKKSVVHCYMDGTFIQPFYQLIDGVLAADIP